MDRTTLAVQHQTAAMGAQVFEVGLFKPSAGDEGRAVTIPAHLGRRNVAQVDSMAPIAKRRRTKCLRKAEGRTQSELG